MKAKDIINFFKQWRANKNFFSPCSLEDQTLCSAISSSIPILFKHIPKAPIEPTQKGTNIRWKCPTCGKRHKNKKKPNYCSHCGQAIDWTEDRCRIKERVMEVESIDKLLSEAAIRSHPDLTPPRKHNQSENEI